jgi:hypothetical protein
MHAGKDFSQKIQGKNLRFFENPKIQGRNLRFIAQRNA